MRNSQPIFVNTFARGGSNIVWEILQSHPDVCSPIEETDKIIWQEAGKWKSAVNIWLSVLGGYPFPHLQKESGYWMYNYGLFHANNYEERHLNKFARNYLDNLLYNWKLKNLNHPFNKYKTQGELYTLEELKRTRVVAKHVNGLVFLIPALIEMYPNSIHFGLVRNGLALCESRLRRKTFKEAGKFGVLYNRIVTRLVEYESIYPNFHLLKFENLLTDPKNFIKDLYGKAGLSYNDDISVRLKAKKFINANGKHDTIFEEGSKYWVDINNFFEFVNPDINENQIMRMHRKDKQLFLKYAKHSMELLEYM